MYCSADVHFYTTFYLLALRDAFSKVQGQASSHVLWQNHESDLTNAQEHCHDGATIFSPPQIRPFSPHCLPQPFHHSQIIFLLHCLATRLKFMTNYALTFKTHSQHHIHIGPNLPCHFGSGETLETNCEDWAFVQHHSLNPSFIMCDNVLYKVFITICMVNKLFKLFTDTNMIFFFLIFTQQLRHKFACNMMHAQIFSKNLMTHGFLNSDLLCCVTNGQTMIGMNKLSGCFLPFLMLKVVLNVHCIKRKFSPL